MCLSAELAAEPKTMAEMTAVGAALNLDSVAPGGNTEKTSFYIIDIRGAFVIFVAVTIRRRRVFRISRDYWHVGDPS